MNAAVDFVQTVLGLVALYLLWHYGFRPYLLDKFRAELFELRDDLFDHAAEGNVDFDDPNYGALREWFNASIRMAHRFGPIDTFILTLFGRRVRDQEPAIEKYVERMQAISRGEHGDALQTYVRRSFVTIGKYFVLRSPLMWVVSLLLFAASLIYFALRAVSLSSKEVGEKVLEKIGRQAEVQVSLEEQKAASHRRRNRLPAGSL
jgi:hypothetical protein